MAVRSRHLPLAVALLFSLLGLQTRRPDFHRRREQRRAGPASTTAFVGARSLSGSRQLPARTLLRSSTDFSPSWIELSDRPPLDPAKGATVLPVFPLPTIQWPGSTVELKISDKVHQSIYHSMLLTGDRRLVAPLARLPGPGKPMDAGAPLEERQLHSMGAVLLLEELREVSEETGGAVKYVAKHKVVARAGIRRLLNPSALFAADGSEALRAEVDILEDPEMEVVQTATGTELVNALKELRFVCESLDEPRLQSEALIKQHVLMLSTWKLIELWQRLQIAARVHREKARVHAELREWIKVQQQKGRLPQQLPRQLDISRLGVPVELMNALEQAQRPGGVEIGEELWQPLLQILAAEGAEARRVLLLEWVQTEVRLARARASLRAVFA